MPNFPPLKSDLTLVFERLELLSQLLQHMAQDFETIVIMEDIFTTTLFPWFPGLKFTAVLSEEFNGLLWGSVTKELSETRNEKGANQHKSYSSQFNPSSLSFSRGDEENLKFNVGLTFDPEAIAFFISQIVEQLQADKSQLIFVSKLKSQINNIRVNNPHLQSEFTLKLIKLLNSNEKIESILGKENHQKNKHIKKRLLNSQSNLLSTNDLTSSFTDENYQETSDDNSQQFREISQNKNDGLSRSNSSSNQQKYPQVCQPIEKALHQQLEQEKLLNQLTTQIRQSLELPVILSTAVEQARKFLKVDRLLIYNFEYSLPLNHQITTEKLQRGCVNYEALASSKISSFQGLTEAENCFLDANHYVGKSGKNFIQAIADIEIAYSQFPCLLELMRKYQVKAKLVVPIIVDEKLWGLLIAQQCSYREWKEKEKRFLKEIAKYLALAIYQAQLYAELEEQKQTLEKRVVERTQDLYDILQSAESANRAKTEFLATMSHELRTPLTCVIGISSTLLRWSYGNRGAKQMPIQKQRAYLQTIHDSGEHLLELINDILDLSQVEAGKAVLKITNFSLSKISYEIWQNFREKAEQKEVKLTLEQKISPQLDLFSADQRRVKQILFNLLSNAIKFTPTGGNVKLKVSRKSNTVKFEIEDTGIGISPEQKPLLFKKFQQLDSAYNRQKGGTGLGLALTKQLVELHGGIIEVESTVNVGSTFTVRIPAQPLESKDEKLKQKGDIYSNSLSLQGSVVLIEQEEEVATVICDILTAAGLKVVWIIEGSAVVDQIILLQPVVVIVDIDLPGMDGIEIIQQLSTTNTTQNMKILALTTLDTETTQKYCYTAGADECLTKPINLEILLNKMIDLVTKKTKLPTK